ncbi:E3 SUMO-protein ligase ZBED1 [Labeo rohita]|uniref:E3 SUMO-protein ligase ZBED1 n=1 Tax=Labeo rohita TaxID=84645 RepID=A0ABQ8L5G1_LABRO|nr:E3 SUMO-protein ligase ZBED1 [Labeo rohita]
MSAGDNAAGGSAESDLVPKHKSSSIIWRYFGFRKDDVNQSDVLCRSCLTKIATKQGSTTNMFHHLKQHHRVLHEECMTMRETPGTSQSSQNKPKQSLIADAFSSVTPYESTSTRHKEITDAITYHIAKDMTLDKRYKIPSRTHFNQVAIPKLYNECKMSVESELREIDHFATTTDLWTSRTTEPYISLTVHFITTNFKLKTRCLQTSFFPAEHTGDNIAEEMRGALADWNLKEDQQVCVTTDNASNMIKAMEVNGWTRLQCFGHRLHLAIEREREREREREKTIYIIMWLFSCCNIIMNYFCTSIFPRKKEVKGDSRISRATGVCKKLVCHFSHSWKKRVALEQAQKRLNLPVYELITECQTRWGSRVLMINRILEHQKALHEVLSEDRNTRETRVEEVSTPPTKKAKKSLGSFFKRSTASATVPIDPTAAIEAELSAYIQSPTIDNDEDPLLWWRLTHKVNFPRLSNMARKYLCMQATSSPSERIFSIVSCQRSCLKPDMVNKLVFLAKNL